ncbi:MAG: L-arabinose isomerase [Clostridia bacterium]|nr:L-arabinose isomerase [Clostridia bacterium]
MFYKEKRIMKYNFWFIVGSQFLYGPEVLETVEIRAKEMAEQLSKSLPYPLIYKVTAKTNKEITDIVREANFDDSCAGIITWCHTFSPSKMWINGLATLQKPYCHFATQYNKEIPNDEIDMDFMNLNQAAHGDREHGFVAARLRMPRKVIAGYWQDQKVHKRIGDWMKAAVGVAVSKSMKVMRFGDNMREVAVTEGDKVEVQTKLGWQVNTWAVGDLVKEMNAVTEAEIDALVAVYSAKYDIATDNIDAIRYQAREEIAIKKMLDREDCKAFSNTFQDLYGMEQLPGLASQHLMAQGYGYGGEGDWKVSAITAIMKAMGEGGNGASAFMEDYTYHLADGEEYSLGAHMLEVCPSLAATDVKPRIETHHLGIGMNEKDPARLVFEGKQGDAIVVSLVDMGGRLRLICQDIVCVKPIMPMPNLPVARVMWRAMPNLTDSIECWITAGGAHHTVLSYDVSAEQMRDWARMMDIEFVHITKDTTVESLEKELFLNDLAWKLK